MNLRNDTSRAMTQKQREAIMRLLPSTISALAKSLDLPRESVRKRLKTLEQQKAAQEAQEMLDLKKAAEVADIKATMAKAARDVAEARATDLETDMAEAGLQELFGG